MLVTSPFRPETGRPLSELADVLLRGPSTLTWGERDPPMHAVYQVLGCDGRWLVLDVGWPAGHAGCDAPCNPNLVATRWSFRAGPQAGSRSRPR